jgi:hypothetical protein
VKIGLRRAVAGLVLTTGHFVLTFMLIAYVFGAGMARFDEGGAPTRAERVASVLAGVLAFPLVNGIGDLLPRNVWPMGFPFEHLLFLANSALWASAIVIAWTWRGRR